jgi:hypothetical protein
MTTGKSFSLTLEERTELEQVLRQRKADGLIVRQTNPLPTGALLLLDKGWQAQAVADALFLDTETVRGWRGLFISLGIRFFYLSPYSKREGHLQTGTTASSSHMRT